MTACPKPRRLTTLKPSMIGSPKRKWDSIDLEEIKASLKRRLSTKETSNTNMRIWGNLICGIVIALSKKVDEELLEPVSRWMDDSDWLNRFKTVKEYTPDWAAYKRKQRRWTKRQKYLAAERLKLYRQDARKKRAFKDDLFSLKKRSSPGKSTDIQFGSDFITPIISPFSPPEQHKKETEQAFRQALSASISDRLPWRLFLMSDLAEAKKFAEFKTYYPENRKKDTVSKLMHFLELEKEERLIINQDEPFGDIVIEPTDAQTKAIICVKDQEGHDYFFDWLTLTDNQRKKIIDDIKANKIISRQVEA
ncbi:hypothetical protein TRIP_B350108 [uncultured Desulfatiglans sp.]|uniref:Uncharacterized protein n=1 Tax=Uncultured Desulfatiglans sp. TaxID=1748965 RepID=A0A653AA52_UNCDX|nr:hypothetical protein TRIP_B350108 [uncultured Desulfatiglans sp.]